MTIDHADVLVSPCYSWVIVPPTIALLYAVAVLIFRAAWHECTWSSMNTPIASASTLLAASVAYVHNAAVAAAVAADDDVGDETTVDHKRRLAAVVFVIASVFHVLRVRRLYSLGPKPGGVRPNCLRGKVVLVTGANSGIGRETTRQLLALGARAVILACRSELRAREAMDAIVASSPNPGARTEYGTLADRMKFLRCDLSDLNSVRLAAKFFDDVSGLPLHILVNNAGIMMGTRETSPSFSGYELTMAANHLGHFLLTQLLLPHMRRTAQKEGGAPGRIINVTSCTYTLASKVGGIDLDDLMCQRRPYTMFSQYAQSKLANILFTTELARREEEAAASEGAGGAGGRVVTSYAVHPGLVRTDVTKNMPWYLRHPDKIFGFFLRILQKTPEAGAYTTVYCAASDDVVGESGMYYVNSAPAPLWDCATDGEAARKLWELSEKLVAEK